MTPAEAALEISVVIPVFNEEGTIGDLVKETHAALDGAGIVHEIVVVDDTSTDSTVAVLKNIVGDFPLRVVRFEKNCGQSSAMREGCLAARAPWIATMDGDGQNDPADIPKLMEARGDFDVVNGYRATRRDNAWRRFVSKIGNGARNFMTGKTVRDVGCSTRIFRRECVEAFPPFKGMHRFLPTLFTLAGYSITELPVNHRPRAEGVTKYTTMGRMFDGIPDLFAVRWIRKRARFPKIAREISAESQGDSE